MFLRRHFSIVGLLAGTFFFALSLTPSLLPRTEMIQGITSGLALSVGYAVGVFLTWLWNYFELPCFTQVKILRYLYYSALAICILTLLIFLWQASEWQNNLRVLLEIEEQARIRSYIVGLIAVPIFLALTLIGRLFLLIQYRVSRKLKQYIPRRVAFVTGLVTAFILFWSIIDGVLFTLILNSADSSYRQIDKAMEAEQEQPQDPMLCGSPESYIDWEDMGVYGREYLSIGPTAEDIEAITGDTAKDPIRVYAGKLAATSFKERAELALQELKRVNAFDRSLLTIITPTGTGWVDPKALAPLEYLHRGDVASVSAQYSYLPSGLSLMFEGEYGAKMARELFLAVYGHWTELPEDDRPDLYLHGLSLGALNSDHSFDHFDIMDDPFDGALWSGPPFRTPTWQRVTAERDEASPAWLPEFRGGSVVRFANQHGGLEEGREEWGDFRIAFLQYASDPITFLSPDYATEEPEWLKEPRGPDVSDEMEWYPFVTLVQLITDMSAGTEYMGYGHKYAPEHYLDSWVALTEPEGWSEEELQELRRWFAEEWEMKDS